MRHDEGDRRGRCELTYLGATPVGVLKQTGSAGGNTIAVSLYQLDADHLGAPRIITRQSDKAIVWRWDTPEAYGAWPANQNPSGLGSFTYNPRLPGQVFDQETGLLQNWRREYNPRIGRYMQSDPIGLAGGMNTYEYVSGNPLMLVDPTGEEECTTPDCVTIIGPRLRFGSTISFGSLMMRWAMMQQDGGGGGGGGGGNAGASKEKTENSEGDSGPCFDFDKFASQVEQNRSSTAANLTALGSAGAVGTMPKTPGELRGLGVPTSELNPYTSQLSRWSSRLGMRELRTFGRTAGGIALSTAATGALIFDGFYNWGVIGKAAVDATSTGGSYGCSKERGRPS